MTPTERGDTLKTTFGMWERGGAWTRTPLTYYGGKQALARQIVPLLQEAA